MDYNYHTHTFRCHHATGLTEEYVKRAIEGGIKHMGFSEHFPYICSDGFEARYRLSVSEVNDYYGEICGLREKYRGRIDISIGYEMEYYPAFFDDMLRNAIEYGAEYLILGQHFLDEEHPLGVYSMTATDSVEYLKKYVSRVTEGMKTGVFSYVAHPDVFNFGGDASVYKEEMAKICSVSAEYNIPLEINFLGIRTNRIYPTELFWEIAGKEGCPVTFGFDAHDVTSAFDCGSLERAEYLVKKYGLNYIGRPTLVKISK